MFRFRLESVQRLRENARDDRRRELAEAIEAERLLIEREADVLAEIESGRVRTRARSQGGVDVDELAHGRRYESQLRQHQQELLRQLELVREELQRRRERLVDADQQVRVLEKLRDRRLKEFDKAELDREGRELDRVGLFDHWRERRAGEASGGDA